MPRFVIPLIVILLTAAAPLSQHDREMQQLILARELETLALTTNAASLIREGRPERALMLLEQRLRDALRQSNKLVDSGVHLPKPLPSLQAAPDRAQRYGQTYDSREIAASAMALARKLR